MNYICRKCGISVRDLMALTNSRCNKGGNHEAYTGHETGPYHCKKCGLSIKDFMALVNSPCSKGGCHEPLE